MNASDPYIILLIQISIVAFTLFAIFKNIIIKSIEKKSNLTAQVIRGEKSMTELHAVYAAAIASCLVLINNAIGIEGHKVLLITIDFLCLTYTFYFNSWFRNSIFFCIRNSINKD
ncbi:MAG: hypothetical protein PF440_01205 [Thiomicrorhabdus sp.]|jgi:hypothetical protein|nr:hypothetical protein [Thiomicrorhabdus sp.]